MAWSMAATAALAALVAVAPAAQGDACSDPSSTATLALGVPITGALASGVTDVYAVQAEVAYSQVTVTVEDPQALLAPEVLAACASPDIGGGRHIDAGGWARVGDAWVVSFAVASPEDVYYALIAPAPTNTSYPVAYAVTATAE